jgi:hypothetical protein
MPWRIIWPLLCVGLFVLGVLGLVPNGAVLLLGPAIVVVWAFTVADAIRRRSRP